MKHHRPRSTTSDRLCYRCGGPHTDSICKFKDSKCYKCQKIGHIAKVCRSTHTAKVQPKNKHKAHVLDENNVTEQSCVLYSMYSNNNNNNNNNNNEDYLYSAQSLKKL